MESSMSPGEEREETKPALDSSETATHKDPASTQLDPSTSTPSMQVNYASAPALEVDSRNDSTNTAPTQLPRMPPSGRSSIAVDADPFDRYGRPNSLMAKYNIDLRSRPQQPRISQERVTKSIRMRIRYTCHLCQTSFGHDRQCINTTCGHRRCQQCSRYPPRKPRPAPVESQMVTAVNAPDAPTAQEEPHDTSADNTCVCHECQTTIEIQIESCPNCHHRICERCTEQSILPNTEASEIPTVLKPEEEPAKALPQERILLPDGDPPKDEEGVSG